MADTYATVATYRDSGVVRTEFIRSEGSRVTERPFTTAFVRPDRFRFEFKNTYPSGPTTRYVVWRAGADVATWWDVGTTLRAGPGLSLSRALAGGTGISGGSAHTVPRLLLADEIEGRALTEVESPERIEDESLDGVNCYRVRARKFGGDPIVVWLGHTDYLLRLIESGHRFDDFSTRTWTYYSPVAGEEVEENLLRFTPPRRADSYKLSLRFDPRGADFAQWIDQFKNAVYENWTVPPAAAFGVAGHTDFEFNVKRDGQVSALRLLSSSGTDALDKAATDALKRSRLLALPDDYDRSIASMQVTFYYNESPDKR